jgi:hypothetical protein
VRAGHVINVLVDGTASAFVPESVFCKLPDVMRRAVAFVEYWMWRRINRFGPLVRRVRPPERAFEDVLVAFSYKAATGDFAVRTEVMARYRAVVFHLSHYFVSTSEKAGNIRSLPNAWLAGDSDITGNAYFQKFFSWYKRPFLVLSFAVSQRFSVRKPWPSRQARCVATGTFHDLTREYPQRKYRDFIDSTGSTAYHPIRKAVYENRKSLSFVECRVSPYRLYSRRSRILDLFKHMRISQKKYFAVDLVDLYNEFQFAVIGEELSGFPALGAIEAMACGCVVVGDPRCYVGLDLVPFNHFMPYEGNLSQLEAIVVRHEKGQMHDIASTAARQVATAFGPSAMWERWGCVLSAIKEGTEIEVDRASSIGCDDGVGKYVARADV